MDRLRYTEFFLLVGFLLYSHGISPTAYTAGFRQEPVRLDSVGSEVSSEKNSFHLKPPGKSLVQGLIQPLEEALDKGVPGIRVEFETEQEFQKLQTQAKEYVEYRKGKLGTEKKAVLFAQCLSSPEENPFCEFLSENLLHSWPREFIFEDLEDLRVANPSQTRRKRRKEDVMLVSMALVNADFRTLQKAKAWEIGRALRRFDSWEPLEQVSEVALRMWGCPPVELTTAMGLKAEEYFPEERFKQLAISLYRRSDSCGSIDNIAAVRARFRLALLHLWEGNCKAADPVLKNLLKERGETYYTRAMYWRGHCARQLGDATTYQLILNRMKDENPIGYHTLALANGGELKSFFENRPRVLLRTQIKEELNSMVRSIEMLQELNENRYASEILRVLKANLEDLEPGFILYVAVLSNRNKDNIPQFQVLSRLFKENPRYISKETLKLFFPLKYFDRISKYRSKVDPFLTIGLIRQESAFNESARSPVGARGLMQLMPATAWRTARVSRRRLYHPATNIHVGVKYFKELLERFNGDAELALASYNAGPHRVESWLKRYPTRNRMLFLDMIPFTETRKYVSLIGRNYFWYYQLYGAAEQSKTARRPANFSAFDHF